MEMTLRSGTICTRSDRYFNSALGISRSSRDPSGCATSGLEPRNGGGALDMRHGGCLQDAKKSLSGLGQRSIIIMVRLTPIRLFWYLALH